MPRATFRASSLALYGFAACCLSGCIVDHASPSTESLLNEPRENARARVFDPVALRVHPLTHVDATGSTCVLIVHVELRDAFGDSVKGLGDLIVEAEGPNGQRIAWDVPGMLDPEANTRRFDPPTRTYRMPLRCPQWVASWAAAPRKAPLTIKARLTRSDGETLAGELALDR
jgi:hypothetical protein